MSLKVPAEFIESLALQFNMDIKKNSSLPVLQTEEPTEISRLLAEHIYRLLCNDHTTLFNILYRIDVNEASVKQALSTPRLTEAATNLAQLVIERQLQKYINKQAAKF